MDYVALGLRVKNKRLEKNMTQEQLAEAVDISSVYVGQIERGDRHMTIDTLVKIANVLQVSIEELLKESTTDNINARLAELVNIAKKLNTADIDKIIDVIKAMYN